MTNREKLEEAAGMNLCFEFFALNGIDPDAEYCSETKEVKNDSLPQVQRD